MSIAFVFPGQGSQSIGMMAGFDDHPAVRATFAEASEVLGEDLWALVTDGPETDLNQTVNTQPVMLTAGVAVWRAWQAAGGATPDIVAGHSLGEYTALVAAGALAFRDAVPLVRFRAQAMQEAVPTGVGAMAAILGLDAQSVAAACAEAVAHPNESQVVEPVNFNTPEQIVVAGHREAVERAMAAATAKGAKRAVLLPVSAPFHSSLMKPAGARLAAKLAGIAVAAPAIPVLHNVDAQEKTTSDAIRAALASQAASPVRWVQTIEAFAARGVTHVVECGPGRVLTGMNRRIDRSLKGFALDASADIDVSQVGARHLTRWQPGRTHGYCGIERTDRSRDRRDARHRRGHRRGAGGCRRDGDRHRDHRRRRGEDRGGARRAPATPAPASASTSATAPRSTPRWRISMRDSARSPSSSTTPASPATTCCCG